MSAYFPVIRRWIMAQDPTGGKAVADALQALLDTANSADTTATGAASDITTLQTDVTALQSDVSALGDEAGLALALAVSPPSTVLPPHTFSWTADATGSLTFDGTTDVSAALTLATVPILKGGTGATTASGARTNLGLAIGTDVQAFDSDLSAVAGLSTTGLMVRSGTGTATTRTLTAPAAGITVSNGDGVSGNPTLALANDLAALEALSGTNTIYYRSAADTWSPVTIGSNLTFSAGTLAASAGTGTVTSVDISSTTLTVSGGPITTSGTLVVNLSAIADQRVLANTSGGSAAPVATAFSSLTGVGSAAKWSTARNLSLTGDVTATLSSVDGSAAVSAAATIANDAVTYAKMQNVSAASRLLGRGSASGSGDPEEISLGTGLAMSGTTLSAAAAGAIGAQVLITETVTSGSQSTVTFSSISSGYRDLKVVIRGRGTTAAAAVNLTLQFNSDSGANYDRFSSDLHFNGTAITALSLGEAFAGTSITIGAIAAGTAPTSAADAYELTVFDYRGTTFQKAVRSDGTIKFANSTGNLYREIVCGWWRSTSAITRIDLTTAAGGFVDGSVVSLYGVF